MRQQSDRGPSQPRALLTSSAVLRREVRRQNNGIADLFPPASRNVYLLLFPTWREEEEGESAGSAKKNRPRIYAALADSLKYRLED